MKLKVTLPSFIGGEIHIPGDKSISHRAAIISALAEGATVINNFSTAVDCYSTLSCLKELGIRINKTDENIIVYGKGLRGLTEPKDILFCGNSGTTMRLLCGLLAGQPFLSVLHGDDSLRKRPMARVIEPLQNMNAIIYGRDNNKYAPICIKGGNLKAIEYKLPIPSAQVKSALLLAGLYADGTQTVIEPIPTRDHTERMLRLFNVSIDRMNTTLRIGIKRTPFSQPLCIPGDISSATYFIALGSMSELNTGILLRNIGINPTRIGIIDTLKMMGANISFINKKIICNEPVADIVVKPATLKGIEISGATIPLIIDELIPLAVIATQSHGTTIVRHAQELRVKETDRIKAIVNELKKMHAKIEEKEDGYVVEGPTRLQGAVCDSYGDHRVAMSLTIAGLIAEGETTITGSECIDISFPEFIKILKEICNGVVSVGEDNTGV